MDGHSFVACSGVFARDDAARLWSPLFPLIGPSPFCFLVDAGSPAPTPRADGRLFVRSAGENHFSIVLVILHVREFNIFFSRAPAMPEFALGERGSDSHP